MWCDLLRDRARETAHPGAGIVDVALGSERGAGGVPAGCDAALLFHKSERTGCAAEVRAPGAKKALAEIWNAEDKDHGSR